MQTLISFLDFPIRSICCDVHGDKSVSTVNSSQTISYGASEGIIWSLETDNSFIVYYYSLKCIIMMQRTLYEYQPLL